MMRRAELGEREVRDDERGRKGMTSVASDRHEGAVRRRKHNLYFVVFKKRLQAKAFVGSMMYFHLPLTFVSLCWFLCIFH